MIGGAATGTSKRGALAFEKIENTLVLRKECVFSISKRFLVGASATVDIIIDPTSIPASNGFIVFPISIKAFQAGPITVDLYYDTDSDDNGTLWMAENRNHESLVTSNLVIRLSPTINDIGTKLSPEFEIFSDGTPAVAVIGGETREDFILNGKKAGKYMLRLINQEANEARAVLAFNWCELP